jgi:hypothetical protein
MKRLREGSLRKFTNYGNPTRFLKKFNGLQLQPATIKRTPFTTKLTAGS